MSGLAILADDVTGACDVGAALAGCGRAVQVAVDGTVPPLEDDTLVVGNTQSRALSPAAAAAAVRGALGGSSPDVLLKKIDTALRGHLGAELEAAVETIGARLAFIVPAVPAAGRVTRGGDQWFDGRLLATTEFARDPEGPGAESSVAVVLGRESARATVLVDRATVAAGGLANRARAAAAAAAAFVVVDAESDVDVERAVAAILALPRPVCLAGSITLATAVARQLRGGRAGARTAWRAAEPVLVVAGSLHSMARAQLAALDATGRALRLEVPALGDVPGTLVEDARRALATGRSVLLTPPPCSDGTPGATARAALEERLAALTGALATTGPIGTLVVIGGETSHRVLGRLGAARLEIGGHLAPLVAAGVIRDGVLAGTPLVIKGGSGGAPATLAELFAPHDEAPLPRAAWTS